MELPPRAQLKISLALISAMLLPLPVSAFMGTAAARLGHVTGNALNFLAGDKYAGSADGTGTSAAFNFPGGICYDSFSGALFVADYYNNVIRKVTTSGAVTLFAGRVTIGPGGSADGTGTAARFYNPSTCVADGAGNIYVTDSSNCTIRKITSAGAVTTLAGTAQTCGFTNGTGSAASFAFPYGIGRDSSGNLYVADAENNVVRKVTTAGAVTTYAGNGTAGVVNSATLTSAQFNYPEGVAVDSSNNIYVIDDNGQTVRKITASGVTTVAGTANTTGSTDGASATFNYPAGIAVDGSGNLYIADTANQVIRKIVGTTTSTFSGAATTAGFADGALTSARFNLPVGVAIDGSGNIYVADSGNSAIRKITASAVSTLAGLTGSGQMGLLDGTGTGAMFDQLLGLTITSAGTIFVADQGNFSIRKVTTTGVTTLYAGTGGSGNTVGANLSSAYGNPQGVAVDSSGNVYEVDLWNNHIRKATSTTTSVFAGATGGNGGTTNGTGTAARFTGPRAIASDGSYNLYVADTANCTIRKITTAAAVTTLAGIAGTCTAVNGTATSATFKNPAGLAVDSAGVIYVADTGNNLIRKISGTTVSTLAGSGTAAYTNGNGTAAAFNAPTGLAVDSSGNVYVADTNNNAIRKISAGGTVTTVIGDGVTGFNSFTTLPTTIANPTGVAIYNNQLFITTPSAIMYTTRLP